MTSFQSAVNAMADPAIRNETTQNFHPNFNEILNDREKQFEFLGQDGVDTLHDLKKCIINNTPIHSALNEKLFALWQKLAAIMK